MSDPNTDLRVIRAEIDLLRARLKLLTAVKSSAGGASRMAIEHLEEALMEIDLWMDWHIDVGDYVVPDDDIPVGDGDVVPAEKAWKPCRVLNVYKNGNLRARSDDGSSTWKGPVSGFRKVPAPT